MFKLPFLLTEAVREAIAMVKGGLSNQCFCPVGAEMTHQLALLLGEASAQPFTEKQRRLEHILWPVLVLFSFLLL